MTYSQPWDTVRSRGTTQGVHLLHIPKQNFKCKSLIAECGKQIAVPSQLSFNPVQLGLTASYSFIMIIYERVDI